MNLKHLSAVTSFGIVIGLIGYWTIGNVLSTVEGTNITIVPTNSVTPLILNNVTPLGTKAVEHFSLESSQVLILEGVVEYNAVELAEQLTALAENGKPIWLKINSPGGSVLDGAALVAAMQASKVPVYTVCTQLCASMAAIIHQYGTKRYMTGKSLLMFHNASMALQGNLPEMLTRLNMMNSYTQKMDAYIAKRSGQTVEQFNTRFSHELWIDDEDSYHAKYSDGTVSILVKGALPKTFLFGTNTIETKLLNFRWE